MSSIKNKDLFSLVNNIKRGTTALLVVVVGGGGNQVQVFLQFLSEARLQSRLETSNAIIEDR